MASGLTEKAQRWLLLMILLSAGEEEKEHSTGK